MVIKPILVQYTYNTWGGFFSSFFCKGCVSDQSSDCDPVYLPDQSQQTSSILCLGSQLVMPDENCFAPVLSEAHPFYSQPFSQFVKITSNSPCIYPRSGNPSHSRTVIFRFMCSYHFGVCIPAETASPWNRENYSLSLIKPSSNLSAGFTYCIFL